MYVFVCMYVCMYIYIYVLNVIIKRFEPKSHAINKKPNAINNANAICTIPKSSRDTFDQLCEVTCSYQGWDMINKQAGTPERIFIGY